MVQKLWKAGLAAIRAPASGARAKHVFYPDVVAIYSGKVLVFEVKYRGEPGPIYIDREKLEKLREFARRAGGEVYIAVKYGRREWMFVKPEDCRETPSGIRVDPQTLEEKGVSLSALIGLVKGQQLITSYTREADKIV